MNTAHREEEHFPYLISKEAKAQQSEIMKPRSEDRQRTEQTACFPRPDLAPRAELEIHK